jgi:UMF1 family MFS transporter
VLYDWANSAFVTTVIAAIFPVYFSTVAAADLRPAAATARFAWATTCALVLEALAAPFLGALADYAAWRKRLLAAFLGVGVSATAAMVCIERGDWLLAAVLFGLGNIGASGSFVFYDSLLPHVAPRAEEMDRLSTTGYAAGYLGGGVLLAVNLAWITRPELFGLADATAAARWSFVSVAVWWALFSVPLFRHVPEPPADVRGGAPQGMGVLLAATRRLRRTLRELRGFRHAFLFLLAFLIYNDGIGTIIRMAVVYGAEIGLPQQALLGAILMVQFVGVPFAVLFGGLATRLGAKPAIFLALLVYAAVCLLGYFMRSAWQFFLLAGLIATVQGGSQALSRSLFARLIPRSRSAEFFAFFAVCEKFAGVLGPALFASAAGATGSSRSAIVVLIGFFVIGGGLLALVDVAEGERAARAADASAA